MLPNRFYGRIAEHADCHDDRTLKAIRLNADGLGRISGERIWSELRRILEGNLAGDLVKTMLSLGLGPPIGKLNVLLSTHLLPSSFYCQYSTVCSVVK